MKVEFALQRIETAIEQFKDNVAVACSFGKDSIVILHMALQFDSNIKVVFCDTGVEFKETYEYTKQITKEWNLNLYKTKPIKSFWQCVKEYGIPQIRGKDKNRVPKCCIYCKEKPSDILYKKIGIKAIITGLRADESRQRKLLALRYDNSDNKDENSFCYYITSKKMYKRNPIMDWTSEDVWDYIKKNKIPINPVYERWGGGGGIQTLWVFTLHSLFKLGNKVI